jgi:hypothetical protein
MDGLEEKLGALLSDPSALGQLQRLAESLSGSFPLPGETGEAPSPGEGSGPPPLMDGRLSELLGRVMSAYAAPSAASGLVAALKPWLRAERAERLDKALRVARLVYAARQVLPELLPGPPGNRKGGAGPV